MQAQITSTTEIVETTDIQGRPFTARVWEGVTDAGVPFTAYIAVVQVARTEDQRTFETELVEHKQPDPLTVRAIDLRFVI